MGPEINIDSILALEKRIEEGLGNVIRLKRTRNSLLNISTRVPPELLAEIFHWNVLPDWDLDELEKGRYNFLLVCHHWFKVASGAPGLGTYWGKTVKQWSQHYRRSRTAPLDLVLGTRSCDIPFNGPLRKALRNRAACDFIRSVHLYGPDADLLHSVVSSLTLDDGGVRDSSIESLRVECTDVDISTYLGRYRFPKLRDLRLMTSAIVSPWDRLKLQATSLTTLSLQFTAFSESPATSQLLSILASYPNIQDLSLYEVIIPHDVGDGSTPRVSLRHLKRLHLSGDCSRVFRLLERLECPDTLDSVSLNLSYCAGEAVSELLEPYLHDRIRRDDQFQNRLWIQVSCGCRSISFDINTLSEFNIQTMPSGNGSPSLSFEAEFADRFPLSAGGKMCVDLMAHVPRERVVYFTVGLDMYATRDLLVTTPSIENLCLSGRVDFDVFLQPDPLLGAELLPSLRHLVLQYYFRKNDSDVDWRPLITYLTHRVSGGQAFSLRLYGRGPPPEVMKEIEGLVEEYNLDYQNEEY